MDWNTSLLLQKSLAEPDGEATHGVTISSWTAEQMLFRQKIYNGQAASRSLRTIAMEVWQLSRHAIHPQSHCRHCQSSSSVLILGDEVWFKAG